MSISHAPSEDEGSARHKRRDAPPPLSWHAALGIPLAAYLWSRSFPGIAVGMWGISVAATSLLGLGWLAWLVVWSRRATRRDARRWWIAPSLVIAAVVLATSSVPLKLRFDLARSEFDSIVEDLPPAGSLDDWAPLDVPDRVGSYDITFGYQVGNNVVLYEEHGSLFNNAGFAYLPDGPDDRLSSGSFEAPRFRSLGGDWYAWTASW